MFLFIINKKFKSMYSNFFFKNKIVKLAMENSVAISLKLDKNSDGIVPS